jgi:hypothetical protein
MLLPNLNFFPSYLFFVFYYERQIHIVNLDLDPDPLKIPDPRIKDPDQQHWLLASRDILAAAAHGFLDYSP